uniref:Fe2OG dioxygenase domain-containing protein n=1 Tax=viral metagenome TaxID=1070528 RepID=A0A6C0BCV9_9ZZZZ
MSRNLLIDFVDQSGYEDMNENLRLMRISLERDSKNIKNKDKLNKTYRIKNFINEQTCLWIINESEKYALENGGWTKKRHKNYPTTDLPVREIQSLSIPLMNLSIKDILPLIANYYDLNPYFLNIIDLFVVKYDVKGQNHLGFHRDGSIISFNILLNNQFEGGGTIINHIGNDNNVEQIIHESERGELFIHSGKLMHSGRKITSGKRYIIVGFVEYIFNFSKIGSGNDTKFNTFDIPIDEMGRTDG